jgi:hypothetical protein
VTLITEILEKGYIIICRDKVDFAGATMSFHEEEKHEFVRTSREVQSWLDIKRHDIWPISHQREFLIPITSLHCQLYLDEGSGRVATMKSLAGDKTRLYSNMSREEMLEYADLHWKTITYRLVRDNAEFLNIEICNKRNGSVVKRNMWEDMSTKTKQSLGAEILGAYPYWAGTKITRTEVI